MGKRFAGVNLPVFSLRSKQGMGTGELLDLIPLIDWCVESGLKVIQILPINDTTMSGEDTEYYPYSILSAFAFHPLYINLLEIAPDLEATMQPIAQKLNRPHLEYGKCMFAKLEFLKLIFELYGEETLASRPFKAFMKRSGGMLKPYAAFCALRDHHGTSDFQKWGEYKRYSDLLVEEVCEQFPVEFTFFVQYHLDRQMQKVTDYAQEKGVKLKGDFPMGVHPYSVEAWRFDEYFREDFSMGAPPDFYNHLGQNWGFPTYDWEEIKEEKFFWLRSRLKWMEQYFDMVRIDHVLGYFRHWEIPTDEVRGLMGNFFPASGFSKEELAAAGFKDLKRLTEPYGKPLPKGLETQRAVLENVEDKKEREKLFTQIENRLFLKREGSYHPRIDLKSTDSFQALSEQEQASVLALFHHYYFEKQEKLWHSSGMEKLKCIQKNTSMEVCAEDIGVLPRCVEEVLRELNMLNLHVQRMPKSFEIEFEDPREFPERCVCTPSNHDTATLRLWWEEDEELRTRYYHTLLKHEGKPPSELTDQLAKEIVQAHLNSRARYALFLIQDLFALSDELRVTDPSAERINDPATPGYKWDYRMHLYVEELLLAKGFSKELRDMVLEAKR